MKNLQYILRRNHERKCAASSEHIFYVEDCATAPEYIFVQKTKNVQLIFFYIEDCMVAFYKHFNTF